MPHTINYSQELNPRQLEAVQSTEGPHLIIAGAGSGKTRVLVFRTAYLVEQGVDPSRILLLTFTRKASSEMLERASGILDERCRNVSGGTFHSFANSVLRRYCEAVGLPRNFTIMDQDDAQNAVNLVRTRLGFAKGDKKFPKKDALLSIISKGVNKATDIEAVVYEEYPHFAEWISPISRIRDGYEQYKRNMHLLDYDDLLVFCEKLLASSPAVCRALSEHYQYIMVDEYQDTNRIQADIVRRLSAVRQNVMVVGDDSQSIYSFRGAHFRNIIDFPKLFPGARVITLEQNYRSSQPILDLTNEVINSAAEKFDKELFTTNTGTSRPVYVDVNDENSQSRYIINKVLRRLSDGVPLHDMAVLFRSGWHSNDLEIELASQGIPFVKYGGQKFVESAHVKDILSFLRAAYNRDNEVAWLRVLTLLKGVGEKTALKIAKDLMVSGAAGGRFSSPASDKSAELSELIKLYNVIDAQNSAPVDVLKPFLDFYYPLLTAHYDDYDKRINDLESLERIAFRYTTLESFLTDMALEPPEKNAVDRGRRAREDSHLVLSTIHSAKGLEWDTVFVIHLTEGYLPSYRSADNVQAIEEERRLFYVATTRAKENLYLLRPQVDRSPRGGYSPGGSFYTRVSRFLEEGSILTRFVKIESDRYGRIDNDAIDDDYSYQGFD